MPRIQLPKLRFSLASLFILILGIAIGFSLNLRIWQLLFSPGSEARMRSLPTYVIEPPDVLSIDVCGDKSEILSGVAGKHLVAPDGKVYLGALRPVYVAGLTIAETRAAIASVVVEKVDSAQVVVDVSAFNSKKFYVVIEGPGNNSTVSQATITGNETVLDAIAQVGGLSDATADIWIARPVPNGGQEKILPIDWDAIASGASAITNYQLMPGDRLFVRSKSGDVSTN